MGRFSNSPQAGDLTSSFGTQLGHPWSSLGAWWGDSLIHPRLDISHRHSACVGEILLLAPGWTSLIIVQRVVGRFSYSPQAGHLWSSFGAWWGDSLTRHRLDISRGCSAHGGEILLLAPGWTSLVIVRHMVGEILLLTPGWTSLIRVRHVVGEILLLAPGWTSLIIQQVVAWRQRSENYIGIS